MTADVLTASLMACASALAAAATGLLLPPRVSLARVCRGVVRGAGGVRRDRRPAPAGWPGALLGAAAAVLAVWLLTGAAPLAVAAAVFGASAVPARRRTVRARERLARADAVPEVLHAFAAELRAGRSPHEALGAVSRDAPEALAADLRSVASTVRSTDDVARALRRAGALPGSAGLGLLAACCEVATSAGAPLAAAVEHAADGLRSDAALRRRAGAMLAGPRSTALLLMVLPVVALALGHSIGARPLDVLSGPVGWISVGAGVPFLLAGVLWTAVLVRRVEESLELAAMPLPSGEPVSR